MKESTMSVRAVPSVFLDRSVGSASSTSHLVLGVALLAVAACTGSGSAAPREGEPTGSGPAKDDRSPKTLAEGKRVFRFETFENELFWTDKARMHEVVRKSVSPATALKVGLKVDADALPSELADSIKRGKVDLDSPDTTVALLKLNAVVGLKGTVKTA